MKVMEDAFYLSISQEKHMNHSFLLCVGINKFLDRDVPKLSYCESDCFRIKRAFDIYNVAKTSEIILNEYATKDNIYKSVRAIPFIANNLYIYISTHGDVIEDTCYLYTYETSHNDVISSGLNLSDLLENINYIKSNNVVLIIDACKINIQRVFNKKITVYCPKKVITFEDTLYKQSLFTKSIIKYLSRYYANNCNIKETNRYQRIRQKLFAQSQKQNTIYICGNSGLGKSYFLRKLKQCEEGICYISLPNIEDITFDIVITLISENLPLASKEKFYNAVDAEPERYVSFYSNINPHHIIIIDHFEHLKENVALGVIKFLDEIPSLKLFASKTYSFYIKPNQLFHFPPLTKEDIDEFLKGTIDSDALNCNDAYLCSNFIQLLDFVYNYQKNNTNIKTIENSKVMQRICKAVAISGGFINEERFSKFFRLKRSDLSQLIKIGLIIEHENIYHPHDIIYNEKITKKELKKFKEIAKNYWKHEVLFHTSAKAIQNYILLLKAFCFKLQKSDINLYKKIIFSLNGRQNTYYLLILYDYFLKNKPPSLLSVPMCESLIEVGKFDEASKLISLSKQKNIDLLALSIELLWWKGQFQNCVQKASSYIDDLSFKKNFSLMCSRGIGNFFLGRWHESSKDLMQVIQFASSTERKQRCFSYFVLATIQGLRGIDFAASVEYFSESVRIAKTSGKLSWLALIYGNIGEIFWKGCYLEQSIEILNIALHLSHLTDNHTLSLEINRNLLHAHYRNNQLNEALAQLKTLADSVKKESDNYVKMQIINTLITHYIFYKDAQYITYLSEAVNLTKDNDEYYIYTLSNLSIIHLITDRNIVLATQKMTHALELSKSGQNWLAIKQCLYDWDEVIEIYNLRLPSSAQVFQKWHQVLQKELLPYLLHLSSLYAFLQQP